MTTCGRCLLNEHVPTVTFDNDGVCNYCKLHDKWEKESQSEKLEKIVKKVKREGKKNLYACIVGISGGCDSSYMLWKMVDFGLRPLAVHWNNNWNTQIAEDNMRCMVKGLNVDYYEMTVNKREYDDICKSFLLASVPDADIPNDIALTTVLYIAAEKFGVKYIMEGHNFRTEGTAPIGWTYMDGQYVASVHKKFGSIPLHSFPNLWFDQWLEWLIKHKIKRIRPLWYLKYDKPKMKQFFNEQYGWKDYGGQHEENKYTAFISNYLHPIKFGIDLRYILLSAQVRSNYLNREEALQKIQEKPNIDESIIDEVKQRLGFSQNQFEEMMQLPIKSHHDYKTYQPLFKKYKALFQMMAKMNLIPKTFYEKYTR